MNNVIFLEYYNKDNFPPGKWANEPDFCKWEHAGLACMIIRDMSLGVWKGFVGVNSAHPFFALSLDSILKTHDAMEIFFSVYGGMTNAGKLPPKYKDIGKFFTDKSSSYLSLWWIGIETSHGGDLMPFIKISDDNIDMAKLSSSQTYKDFAFIRRETNKLAKCISKVK